jgi:hypothetical protein
MCLKKNVAEHGLNIERSLRIRVIKGIITS